MRWSGRHPRNLVALILQQFRNWYHGYHCARAGLRYCSNADRRAGAGIAIHWFSRIMSKKMSGILLVYGVLLSGLSFLIHLISPEGTNLAIITGFACGGVSLLWGLAAITGK